MIKKTVRERLLASTMICGAAFAAFAAMPANAQDAGNVTEATEVIVTGSRIARPNLEAASQVQVIDQRLIESTGDINVGDIVRTLPAAGVTGLSATNSNFFTQNNGVATIDLRNLGADRTLVLVNGRRYVAGVPGSSNVDFNSLPTEFISRIDVVTGGSSAVYGSDALAGVVNIITQKNFEGFEVFGQYGQTERNDLERYRLGLKVGSNFADGRGNVVSTLSYDNSGPVYARNRAEYQMDTDCLGGAYFGTDTRANSCPFFSSFPPQGNALVPRTGAGNLQRTVLPDGTTVPYVGSRDGFNRNAQRLLYVPSESIKFTTQLNYEVAPWANFFAEASYYFGETFSDKEPTPLGSSDLYRDEATGAPQNPSCTGTGAATICRNGIPILSAIVPESLRQAVRNANPGALDQNLVVGYNRRLSEVGNRQDSANRQLIRLVAGVDGDINDDLSYEFSLNWGRTQVNQSSQGPVLKDRFIQATTAIVDANGNVVCADPVARGRGCVPFYVFTPTTAQQEQNRQANSFFAINSQFDSHIEQFVAMGFLNGKAFTAPAGDVNFAVGAEYRLEESSNVPDPTIQLGLSSTNRAGATYGEFEVYEIFGELRVPVLADLPFVKSLDLNLAGRWSDYSTAGNTSAFTASIEYMPVDFLKLRTQYARAVRAPNIAELFGGRGETFVGVTDPCRGLTLSGGQPAFFNNRTSSTSGINPTSVGSSTAVACFSDPALAARVARDGFFIETQPELQGKGGFNESNPNLGVETADTFTAGVLFNPRWNQWWQALTISVDYFDIEVQDAIQGYGRGLTASRCYGGSITNQLDPFYCQFLRRYQPGSANVGAIFETNSTQFNIGQLNTRGIDVQASYNLDLTDAFATEADLGRVLFSLSYQNLLEYTTIAVPGAPASNSKGFVGLPEHEAVLDILYNRGPLQWTWQATYQGSACYFALGCVKDDYINDLPIGPRVFWDTQVRYDLNDTVRLFFGIDNVFDEFVRVGAGYNQPTGWHTEPDSYDGIGRRYYAGFRLRF